MFPFIFCSLVAFGLIVLLVVVASHTINADSQHLGETGRGPYDSEGNEL